MARCLVLVGRASWSEHRTAFTLPTMCVCIVLRSIVMPNQCNKRYTLFAHLRIYNKESAMYNVQCYRACVYMLRKYLFIEPRVFGMSLYLHSKLEQGVYNWSWDLSDSSRLYETSEIFLSDFARLSQTSQTSEIFLDFRDFFWLFLSRIRS